MIKHQYMCTQFKRKEPVGAGIRELGAFVSYWYLVTDMDCTLVFRSINSASPFSQHSILFPVIDFFSRFNSHDLIKSRLPVV